MDQDNCFYNLNKSIPFICCQIFAVPFSKLREIHPFLYQADGAIISAHHQLMKPEPAIYTKLIQKYQLNPENSVFIDDLPDNINAAIDLGMKGIVFKSQVNQRAIISDGRHHFNVNCSHNGTVAKRLDQGIRANITGA